MLQPDAMGVRSPHQPGVHPVSEPAHQPARHTPPPPLKESKWHLLIWAVLFLVVAGLTSLIWWRVHTATLAAMANLKSIPPIPVVVTEARIGDMPIYLPELGNVTAFNTVTIRTRVNGQLNQVAFDEGQMVQKGQLLAQIDPRPYQAAVEEAQGQLAKDQASLENARLDLTRYVQAPPGTFTDQQIATQKAMVDQDAGIVQSDRGTLDNAKVQLDFCTITSPLTGRIGLRQVDPGNYVQTSDANGLAVITQIQPIAVIFTIADVDIPKIMGDSSTVPNLEADAYSSDFSEKLGVGYLAAVDSQIDPTTAKLKLKAAFDNKDNALFPNQFVNIQLLTRTVHGAVIIPQAAVQRGPDNSTFVYVVKTDGTDHSVEVRNITLGPQAGDSQVVRSGLAAGETIVTDGVDRLLDGSKVTPTEMAAPATQPTTGHHHHHHNSEDESSGAATTRTAE